MEEVLDPLEGLRLVAVNHQLVCSSTAEPQRTDPAARPGARSSLGPRNWLRTERACSDPPCPSSGSGSGSRVSGSRPRLHRTLPSPDVAARERSRVRNLRQAFRSLQAALPSVPPDTKLSKLDVLVLATDYIAHLTETLDPPGRGGAPLAAQQALLARPGGRLRPIKKWPMRSLLYCGSFSQVLHGVPANQLAPFGTQPLTPGQDG